MTATSALSPPPPAEAKQPTDGAETSSTVPPASAFQPPKRKRRGGNGTPTYVCEYHDEALRCLHHGIRRRRIPFSDLALVHLDAHPDMAASTSMPAETVFEAPRDVHHALRTDPGGIAQWILPAVYGGHVASVWWVRPAWSGQIADGVYDVTVGRARRAEEFVEAAGQGMGNGAPGPLGTTVAVASRTRDAAVPQVPVLATPVACSNALAAKELPPTPAAATSGAGGVASPSETIHISCSEPYFVEDGLYCPSSKMLGGKPLRYVVGQAAGALEPLPPLAPAGRPWIFDVCLDYFVCGNPFLSQVRPEIAAPFAAVQNAVTFRQGAVSDVAEFLAERDAFDIAYSAMLRDAVARAQRGELAGDAAEDYDEVELVGLLGGHLPEARREALLDALSDALDAAMASELQQILEAGDMVTLPLHGATAEEVEQRLASFDAFLQRLVSSGGLGSKPVAVTIARSVVDGFCPMRWLCKLESSVLESVERHIGAIELVYSDELDALEVL